MSTQVYDLSKGLQRVAVYDLPPREAVRNAYAQFGKGDFETWNYAQYDSLVVENRFSFGCGDFAAWKEGMETAEGRKKEIETTR